MKKETFMGKYTIFSLELLKTEVKQKNIPEIIEYFKAKVDAHPVAQYVGLFDHYTHTKKIDGPIMEGILDAQNFLFCFGSAIPHHKILAVRPRIIGICEFEDKFTIDFTEAPKEELHDVMESWAKALKK